MQHQAPGVERAALLAELITQPATATGIPAMCETGSTTDEEWQHRRHAGLRLAGLKSGDRFLDVAAGPGGLSLPAARLGAKVLATDWSPAGIERFEARVWAEGLSDAEGRVMDAHALEIDDDTFDVTGSQGGPADRVWLTGRVSMAASGALPLTGYTDDKRLVWLEALNLGD